MCIVSEVSGGCRQIGRSWATPPPLNHGDLEGNRRGAAFTQRRGETEKQKEEGMLNLPGDNYPDSRILLRHPWDKRGPWTAHGPADLRQICVRLPSPRGFKIPVSHPPSINLRTKHKPAVFKCIYVYLYVSISSITHMSDFPVWQKLVTAVWGGGGADSTPQRIWLPADISRTVCWCLDAGMKR